MEQPKRYLVVFRQPQRGETFWREGMFCGVSPTDPEALDDQPVIVTDANEGKLLTLAIEMRDCLDALLHDGDNYLVGPVSDVAAALVRRFDQWEPGTIEQTSGGPVPGVYSPGQPGARP